MSETLMGMSHREAITQLQKLTDAEVIRLYVGWVGGSPCTGFRFPDSGTVERGVGRFIQDLCGVLEGGGGLKLEGHEQAMLLEFRKQIWGELA